MIEVRNVKDIQNDAAGWLYFIQQGYDGPVKIGRARNPRVRLSELQMGCPDELRILVAVPGGAEHEEWVHGYLGRARIRGEWYDGDRVLAFLCDELRLEESLREAGVIA